MRRKRLIIIIGSLTAVLLGIVLGFAPYVRSRVDGVADRYGARVEVDWVFPAWGGVSLRGVHVTHPDAPSMRVDLDRVDIGWGSPRKVLVDGGRARFEGDPEEIARQLEKVRARMPAQEGGKSGGGTELTLKRFDVTYSGSAGSAELRSVNVERDGAKFVLSAEAGKADSTVARGTFAQGRVEVERRDGQTRLVAVATQGLELTADLGSGTVASSIDLSSAAGDGRVVRVRKSLARLAELFDAHVAPEGVVELAGVRAELVRGDQRLSFGPATLRLSKKDGRVVGEYIAGGAAAAPAAVPGAAPEPAEDSLVVRAPFPRGDEPLAIEVRGGPISLASLGVKPGEFHLADVERATFRANAKFEIDPQGEVLSFDGEAQVQGLSASLPQVAKDPLRGISASFRGSVRAALDGSKISVKGGELEIGRVRLATTFDATFEPPTKLKEPPHLKLDASFEVPLVPCQALIDAAPQGLLPTIAGMRLAGSLSLKGAAKFDTAKIDKHFDVRWDLSSSCRVTEAPPNVDVARFKKAFVRTVYSPKGERNVEIQTGPGTKSWTRYSAISRYMELGATSFEDGRFQRHEGFDQEAIRNSIRENLRQWQFVRGASTISMQLAKNLYLDRDKLVGRKLEEAFLTMYLEEALTKEQIMELYLNVVEFGPNVYGVDQAASHYFNTSPAALTLSQAFYLASILPSPRTQHFGAGGALTPSWLKFLRTVMKHANKLKRLSDEELQMGLAEIPVRGGRPMRDPDAESVPGGAAHDDADLKPEPEAPNDAP